MSWWGSLEVTYFLCFFFWYELCFCFFLCSFFVVCIVVFLRFFSGMNCVFLFFVWIVFLFVLFFWYELCFFIFLCFFLCFFCGMNCVLFLCFFCGRNCFFFWYELWFCLCLFLVWIVFFLCFFLCSGAPEKHKKKHKKAQKKHEKSTISLEKMNLRPPGLDSLRTSGPANVSHHFLFPTSFPKESFRSEPMPGAGKWKNVIIICCVLRTSTTIVGGTPL